MGHIPGAVAESFVIETKDELLPTANRHPKARAARQE